MGHILSVVHLAMLLMANDGPIVPTLIIHGTNDATVPIDASGRPAAKGIATAQFKEYDGAPHGLLVTHQAQLEHDLLTFLKT